MREIGPARRAAQFGVFEADFDSGELRKRGVKVKLQDQPFQILEILLECPGQVVSRETLRQRIWPADTFVDFDHGLYNAVKRLREALGDTADNPRFIETLSRRGYRFIGKVNVNGNGTTAVTPAQPVIGPTAAGQVSAPPSYRFAYPAQAGQCDGAAEVFIGPTLSRKLVAVVALLLLCSALTWWFTRHISEKVAPIVEEIPLTGIAGVELTPAFSPDGNQVAFQGYPDFGTAGIYTALVGGENLLQLTRSANDCCPAWSPDGSYLAFTSSSEHHSSIHLIPALGGTERQVYVRAGSRHPADGSLSWSPDGALLAFSECDTADRCQISLLSLADYKVRGLSSPPGGHQDRSPVFSPDGRKVAFVRSFGSASFMSGDLFVVPLGSGQPRQLTFDNRFIWGSPAWTPDSREIIFSSDRGGLATLWRISASGEHLRPLEGVGPVSMDASIPLHGGRLAYVHRIGTQKLWLLSLRDQTHAKGPPIAVVSSKASNALPQFARDGKRIAFESERSGYDEVWAANTDGSGVVQLTSMAGYAGTPHWTPDGRSVVFDFRARRNSEIYVVSVPPSSPRLLPTFEDADSVVPSCSLDGQSIYFASKRGREDFQVWKVAVTGGAPVQITKHGGYAAVESPDGFLYYSKGLDEPAIWRVPIPGGPETLVLDPPGLANYANWAPGRGGIYFLDAKTYPHNTIVFFNFATHKLSPVWTLERELYVGLAVSTDEKSIIYSQNDQDEYNIRIVKNFR